MMNEAYICVGTDGTRLLQNELVTYMEALNINNNSSQGVRLLVNNFLNTTRPGLYLSRGSCKTRAYALVEVGSCLKFYLVYFLLESMDPIGVESEKVPPATKYVYCLVDETSSNIVRRTRVLITHF